MVLRRQYLLQYLILFQMVSEMALLGLKTWIIQLLVILLTGVEFSLSWFWMRLFVMCEPMWISVFQAIQNKDDARRFLPIWNAVINSLREEDLLNNRWSENGCAFIHMLPIICNVALLKRIVDFLLFFELLVNPIRVATSTREFSMWKKKNLGICGLVKDQMKLFSDNILQSFAETLHFPEYVVSYRERGMLEMPPNGDTYPNGKKDTVMCWPLFLLANKVPNPRNVCIFYCSLILFWRYILYWYFLFN